MPDNGVSLFFLGNACDKYQRQNEAYYKQEQDLMQEVISDASDNSSIDLQHVSPSHVKYEHSTKYIKY